jgi:hypothetical protein
MSNLAEIGVLVGVGVAVAVAVDVGRGVAVSVGVAVAVAVFVAEVVINDKSSNIALPPDGLAVVMLAWTMAQRAEEGATDGGALIG